MLKLLTLRNPISGMGKRFNGIWSKDCQTMEKAITEKMKKIVQLQDKENQQQKMNEFKSEMDKLKKAFLTSHQQIEKEFNGKMKKMIEDQQQQRTTMPFVPIPNNEKMGNLDQQAIKLCNPAWNQWDQILIKLVLVREGFDAGEHLYATTDDNDWEWHNVFALNGFPISRELCGNGTELSTADIYYYEVIVWHSDDCDCGINVGLSGGLPSNYIFDEFHPNFYYLPTVCFSPYHHCCLSGTKHEFEELQNRAIKPELREDLRSRSGDVIGCGILFHSNDKLFIFFTLNGNLMGKPIPITPSVDRLYPTVRMACGAVEANFGYNPAKPFKFDIGKCPELDVE